jgi:hypothetical protein
MPRSRGRGIINHDLFLSNPQLRKVIRGALDGHPVICALGWPATTFVSSIM